jgi:glucose/arabinose dehydrogenase
VNFLILDLLSHRQYLYISHAEYFINSGKCSKAYITRFDTKERTFETIFRTNPCIGGIGAWTEFSGRLATDGRSLYSAWGNVYMDIYRNTFPRSGICCLTKNYEDSLTDSNYVGSVLKTDLVKKTTEKFASGFRNPQGLYYDSVRNILWLSDHGARGGDELNSIRKGLNYGYPYVSLGRPYLNTSLKTSDNPKSRYGTHSNFTSPVFSWTPSIAPSQVISVPSVSQFSDWWSKDIIVSSLKDKSLYRIRLSGNSRVMYAERIEIGSRIRDLSFSDSLIVGSTDDGAIFTIRKSEITPEGTFPQKS